MSGVMVGINPTTVRHQVGKCPACGSGLWAEVDLNVTVYEPRLDREGQPSVSTTPFAMGMRLSHECVSGRDPVGAAS